MKYSGFSFINRYPFPIRWLRKVRLSNKINFRPFFFTLHPTYARINAALKYIHNAEKRICAVVSNNLPLQSFEEYPKNWMYSRIVQNMPNDKDSLFPNCVYKRSVEEVRQRTPIKNTTNAMKKVCTYIICRLARLNEANSCFQLKYLGKMK
jgi:hypothetical protein